MKKLIIFCMLFLSGFCVTAQSLGQDVVARDLWIKRGMTTSRLITGSHLLFINPSSGKVFSTDSIPSWMVLSGNMWKRIGGVISPSVLSDTFNLGQYGYKLNFYPSTGNMTIGQYNYAKPNTYSNLVIGINDTTNSSFCLYVGDDNKIYSNNSAAIGEGLFGLGGNSLSVGKYNSDTATSIFNVGWGNGNLNRFNIMEVLPDSTVNVNLDLYVDRYFHYEMPHCYFTLVDTTGSSLNLNQNIWATFTGLTDKESHEINYLTNDTIQYQALEPCHLTWVVEVNGTTSNANDDIWVRVINVTDNAVVDYNMNTSNGSGNYTQWSIDGYDINCDPGDKYLVQIKNKTNGNNLTQYVVSIRATVLHFE